VRQIGDQNGADGRGWSRGTLVGVPRRPIVLAASGALAGIAAFSGCGDDGVEADAARFCGEAAANRDRILNPPMATEAELEATLDFYRLMGQLAPLAIAEQWNEIVAAMETANTIVPGDPDSEQRVAMQAYATERAAYEVSVWLKRNCGVDIPVVTIAPQDPAPARTTTIVPPPTTAAP
jgi:hypothetical protein